ncbi:MAG: CPBP family intramembrane metalloprotease [Theionarchaea archaeon]|nr:CPBP family intramembrane metalloprotease [Theionarchaea archaeon]
MKSILSSLPMQYRAILSTIGLCAVIYLYYRGETIFQALALILFIVVLYEWTETIGGFSDFQLKKEKWPLNVVVGVLIGLAMFGLYIAYRNFDFASIEFNVSIFAAVSLVAAAEEFFFRGYLQGKLSPAFKVIPRIAIVTVLFGLYKVSVFSSMRGLFSLAEIVVISCLGSIILSIELEKTHNLLAPVISHALWDNLVYSNMGTVPAWISATPEWTESLYAVLYKCAGLFCSHWEPSCYYIAGKQFITCSGCTGIFLGVFFAFFMYQDAFYRKLHTVKFYVPGLLPQVLMFFGLNILTWTGILDVGSLSDFQLQMTNYAYTIFGLLFGFTGSVVLINVIKAQGERWDALINQWLKDYEYLIIPALLLAFLTNPLSNPQVTALIFFSLLVVYGIVTAVVFAVLLLVTPLKK